MAGAVALADDGAAMDKENQSTNVFQAEIVKRSISTSLGETQQRCNKIKDIFLINMMSMVQCQRFD